MPLTPANPIRALSQRDNKDSAELKLTGASWVWVYDGLTAAVKVRHYSPKTLDAYKIWIQKFQICTQSKDPRWVAMDDVKGFLSLLAVHKKLPRPAKIRLSMRYCFYSDTYWKRNSKKSRAWSGPNEGAISRSCCRGKK